MESDSQPSQTFVPIEERYKQFYDEAMKYSSGKFPVEYLQSLLHRLAAKDLELQQRERELYAHQQNLIMAQSQQESGYRNYRSRGRFTSSPHPYRRGLSMGGLSMGGRGDDRPPRYEKELGDRRGRNDYNYLPRSREDRKDNKPDRSDRPNRYNKPRTPPTNSTNSQNFTPNVVNEFTNTQLEDGEYNPEQVICNVCTDC